MFSASDIQPALDALRQQLLGLEKRRLLCLSSTANINNPPFYIGGLRYAGDFAAANVIISSGAFVEPVLHSLGDLVEAIFVDCEVKTPLHDLPQRVLALSPKAEVVQYKPNDLTVEALDMLLSGLRADWHGQKVAIIGGGNIGAKAALKLSERGAGVLLYGRSQARLQLVANGLNAIRRGTGDIAVAETMPEACRDATLLLGCTPGTAAVDAPAIQLLAPSAIVIDVGNGTFAPQAIQEAHRCGHRLLCLSPQASFAGFLQHWIEAKVFMANLGRRKLEEGFTLISPGLIGEYGDILVDNINAPSRIIGVCDGRGDTLTGDAAKPYIERFKAYDF